MKKVILMIFLLLLVACQDRDNQEKVQVTENIEGIAAKFFDAVQTKSTDALLNDFVYTEEMADAMTENLIDSIYKDIDDNFGAFKIIEGKTQSQNDGYDIVSIHVAYEKGYLSHNIVFDKNAYIAGYNYRISQSILNDANLDSRSIEEISLEFVEDLKNKNTEILLTYSYEAQMQAAFNKEMIETIYGDLEQKFGDFIKVEKTETSSQGNYTIVSVICQYELSNVSMNIVFSENKLISGFNYFEMAKENSGEFQEIDVNFGLEAFPLNASLSMPESTDELPAVVLVHGSGPNDRDESIYGNKPFRDIAMGLYQEGIAVLRYDKRTYTYAREIIKEGYEEFSIYHETIDDAVLAVDYLKSLDGIDPDRIYVMGHSLGGHLGPLIAEETDLAGLLLVAANVTPIHELMVDQYEYIYSLDNQITDDEQASLDAVIAARDRINSPIIEAYSLEELLGLPSGYWQELNAYKPLQVANRLNIPIAIFQGNRDYQVPIKEYEAWLAVLIDAKSYLYDDLNHLMMEGQGQAGPEEYMTAGHVDENFIKDMVNFIKSIE